MKTGTKSLLFGVHQIFIHPIFVYTAWCELYGFTLDIRIILSCIIHDWGYFGKINMDDEEGRTHPILAAKIMGILFGKEWYYFCLYHSRFLAKKDNAQYSKLCVADKLSIVLTPWWLYLPLARITGELKEYMDSEIPALGKTDKQWYLAVQKYMRKWVTEHRDCKVDTWTKL